MTKPMEADAMDDGERHRMDGRLARQGGAPREAWRSIPMGLDGVAIRAWQSGWDDEQARIRAGGLPMTEGERLSMEGDLAFVAAMERALAWAGAGIDPRDTDGIRLDGDGSVHLAGGTAARLMGLAGCGDPEGHGASEGDWLLEPAMAESWAEAARRRIEVSLRPHLWTAATGDR